MNNSVFTFQIWSWAHMFSRLISERKAKAARCSVALAWSPSYGRSELSLLTVNSITVPLIWYSKTILLKIIEVLKESFYVCLLTPLSYFNRYEYIFLSIKNALLLRTTEAAGFRYISEHSCKNYLWFHPLLF